MLEVEEGLALDQAKWKRTNLSPIKALNKKDYKQQEILQSFVFFFQGVFNILSKYWIMVPSEVIKAFFKILLTVLVYDVSTAGVRIEVVKVGWCLSMSEISKYVQSNGKWRFQELFNNFEN